MPSEGENGAVALAATAPILSLRNVTMTFGSTRALHSIDLDLRPGEVLGILGHNGSGKSTLVGVLTGRLTPSPGAVAMLRGKEVGYPLNRDEVGLGVVTQDLGLVDNLTGLENFTIGRRVNPERRSRFGIGWRSERRKAEETLDRYGVSVDLRRPIAEIRLLDRALLAIVRCAEDLERSKQGENRPGVIILDEPTVFLPEREQHFLFDLVRRNAARQTSVIIISHDMNVIRELTNRVIVLRNGELVAERAMPETPDAELVELIVGHSLGETAPKVGDGVPATSALDAPGPADVESSGSTVDTPEVDDTPAEDLDDLSIVYRVSGLRGSRVDGLDLTARRGEILGVAGLLGSGAEELPYLLFGSLKASAGTVTVGTENVPARSLTPNASIAMGVGLVPENRGADGLVGAMTIWENMLLLVNTRYYRRGAMRHGEVRKAAGKLCREFDVRPPDPRRLVSSLSGGNQQKILIAKWRTIDPEVLILHEPTQGVDVGARHAIHQIVRKMADGGAAILWFTSDYEEMASVCDRVIVLAEGKVLRQLRDDERTTKGIAAATVGANEALGVLG